MEKLRKDMEKSKGETVVLSTGLKDKGLLNEEDVEEEEEDYEDDDYGRFTDEDDVINEDEDEEVAHFSF